MITIFSLSFCIVPQDRKTRSAQCSRQFSLYSMSRVRKLANRLRTYAEDTLWINALAVSIAAYTHLANRLKTCGYMPSLSPFQPTPSSASPVTEPCPARRRAAEAVTHRVMSSTWLPTTTACCERTPACCSAWKSWARSPAAPPTRSSATASVYVMMTSSEIFRAQVYYRT